MSEIQSEAVVGDDGELLEADQDIDLNVYAAYVKADHPDPTRFQRLLSYISGNIFRSIIVLVIVVFVAVAIMAILTLLIRPDRLGLNDFLQTIEVPKHEYATLAPPIRSQPFIAPEAPQPIPMPTQPSREDNVTRV